MKTKPLSPLQWLMTTPALFAFAFRTAASPTDMTVVSGTATAQPNGSQLNITTSQNAVLNWASFNIAAGEKTVFIQPTASSVVFNNIGGQSASQIYGSLQANGIVVLLNSSGFYFGPNSFVSAAGLVVSTANCTPPQNFNGAWQFNGPPPLASIVNYGQIKIGKGGDCYFIADKIENHGDISAPAGNIGFAAGQTVTLSERPDGRGMSMAVTLPQGSVDNCGNVVADGGTIALNAKVVNQDGLVQANSVQSQNGVIEFVAADALHLGADSKISASGDDAEGGSAGGAITLKSDNVFSDASGSQISVKGGAHGGNGGRVEISAPRMAAIHSTVDGRAQAGSTGGKLLLDPDYIELGNNGGDSAGSGTVAVDDNPGGTLYLNVNSAFIGLSQITLQARHDITVADNTAWNLSGSTSVSSGQLTLEAGGNIVFGNGASIYDANNWAIKLLAGVSDFTSHTVAPGNGSIFIDSNDQNNPSYIQTASGAINLVAGADIILGNGYVNTTAGGSINAHALAGSIDTGSVYQGYYFNDANTASDGCTVGSFVGGISTLAGGDVNLTAGGNVASLLPTSGGYYYDGTQLPITDHFDGTAGSGAYGNQSGQTGNVNIVAGGNVTGHYLVANGTGTIVAGASMDANGNPVKNLAGTYVLKTMGSAGTDSSEHGLALSLLGAVAGGWNVTAARDIFLQEVRNPNGVFNFTAGGADHLFDYAADDFVNLSAGYQVQLGSTALPRDTGDRLTVPVIYPSILNVTAGAGGVTLNANSTGNQLILFPSAFGSLTLNTTGSFVSPPPSGDTQVPQVFSLIVSDSGQNQYTKDGDFGMKDHAVTPVHLNSEIPVTLNISGDMSLVKLVIPEAAQITVGGSMKNCSFQGMNLSAADVTTIKVTGDIYYRGAFTSVDLSSVAGDQSPNFEAIGRTTSSETSATTLLSSLYYNKDTKVLTYQDIKGKSLANILALLQNLPVQKVDGNGVLLWKDVEQTIPDTEIVSAITPAAAQALLAQYNQLGVQASDTSGYVIGGGGTFKIAAHDVDLGTSAGIISSGVGLYRVAGDYALKKYFTTGADLVLDLTGKLNMFSSLIASYNGGSIYLNADGDVNVGSLDFNVNTLGARGVFATGQGNVAVYAGGSVNVDGSRIASYDTRPASLDVVAPGGSVTVISRNGNVHVGSGGSGFVVVNSFYVDPVTRAVTAQNPTMPGSGILQVSYNLTGNVLVEALNGDVKIGAGGVQQLLLKGQLSDFDFNSPGQLLNHNDLNQLMSLVLSGADQEAFQLQNKINGISTGSQIPVVDVYAGYALEKLDASLNPVLDNYGNPAISALNLVAGTLVPTADSKNIDASGSGIVGAGTANLKASGGITGNIFSLGDVNLDANKNINANVFGLGNVSVASAAGSISGTIIGVGGVSASGGSIEANLESNGSISGETSGDKGLSAGTAAAAVAQAVSGDEATKTTKKADDTNSDDEINKKKKGIALAQKTSRVTVILPPKS